VNVFTNPGELTPEELDEFESTMRAAIRKALRRSPVVMPPQPVTSHDPLRHHDAHSDKHGAFGGDGFGKLAEQFARFLGTPKYLAGQTLFVAIWVVMNIVGVVVHWDPYPFILLNLLFSTQAAYAAPMILLAQTRQADRDKAVEKADATHREELSERQEKLLEQNTALTEQVHALLEQNTKLTTEVHEALTAGKSEDS